MLFSVPDSVEMGIKILIHMEKNGGRMNGPKMAVELGYSLNTLVKVCQPMTRAGILESTRGPGGGLDLAREIDDMSVLELATILKPHIGEMNPHLRRRNMIKGELLCTLERIKIKDLK